MARPTSQGDEILGRPKGRPIKEVFEDIAGWGSSHEVAEKLRELGIKGKRDCTTACPMANYILQETNVEEVAELEVEGMQTYYGTSVYNLEVIDNPDNMWLFVENFDGGEYPFLRDEEETEQEPEEDPDQFPLWG